MGDNNHWWKRIKTKDAVVLRKWSKLERIAFEYELARRMTKRKDAVCFIDLGWRTKIAVEKHFRHEGHAVCLLLTPDDLPEIQRVLKTPASIKADIMRPGFSHPMIHSWNLHASDRQLLESFMALIAIERRRQGIEETPIVNTRQHPYAST